MDLPIKYEFILEPDRRPLSLDENDLRRPERIKMSLESICLAQRSMLVEEALIGPLPFFQEQMSEMGHFGRFWPVRRMSGSGVIPEMLVRC